MGLPLATDWAEVLVPPVWSLVLAGLLVGAAWLWREPVSRALARLGISRFNVLGVELIASQTRDAYAARQQTPPGEQALRQFAALSIRLEPLIRDRGRRVLWVDDLPRTHETETRLLRGLGVEIENVLGTEEALARIERDLASFDLLITDWSRGEDPDAGPRLLEALGPGFRLPVLMYVAELSAERRGRAGALGAKLVTADPDELLKQALVELATAP